MLMHPRKLQLHLRQLNRRWQYFASGLNTKHQVNMSNTSIFQVSNYPFLLPFVFKLIVIIGQKIATKL
jgi:hypothetical protein